MARQGASERDGRVNLSGAEVLLLEPFSRRPSIAGQLLAGFGVQTLARRFEPEDALQYLANRRVDPVICDADLPSGEGFTFVRKLRRVRNSVSQAQYVPTLLVAGHCPEKRVLEARDCGASLVLRKPYSPSALLDRILWLSRDNRAFVEGASYVGPERPEDREDVEVRL